ncbi:MAG TPA: TolC family protein [Chitinophaga sp.]
MNKWILYIAVILSPAALQAQQLSLHDAVETALRNNLGIQLARNNVSAAGINNSYGVAGGLPQVTASGSDVEQVTSIKQEYANPANNKTSDNASSNNLSAALNASMLLYNGNRVQNAHHRLGLIESQSKQQLSSRALTLVYNVMLRYYDIIRQQSYARTLSASIDVSREKLEIVKAQQSAGVANNADLFQAQVDLNTQVQNLQAQQLVIEQAKTDLLTLLTLKPDSAINISDTILVDRSVELGPVLNTIQSNPDISMADQQISINEYIEKETAAQRYPSLSANAGYNFSHTKNAAGFSLLNQSYGPFAGVGVSIPIFNGSIYKKQTQIADINVKNAQLLKDTLVLNYSSNAVKNWQAYNNNLQQLETAKANYDLSGKLLDLVLQRFQLKQATIVDLKNAQDSFENAGYLLVNVSFSAKAAELRLKYYANQLQF